MPAALLGELVRRDRLQLLMEESEARSLRERLIVIAIYEELRALAHEGRDAVVRRFAIGWREKQKSVTDNAFAPLSLRARLSVRLETGAAQDGGSPGRRRPRGE